MEQLTIRELVQLVESLLFGKQMYVADLVEKVEKLTGQKLLKRQTDAVLAFLLQRYGKPSTYGFEFCRHDGLVYFRTKHITEIVTSDL
jgi:hypothetical protein